MMIVGQALLRRPRRPPGSPKTLLVDGGAADRGTQLLRGFPEEEPELVLAAGIQGFATGGVMPMMGIMYSARFGTLSFGRVLGYVNLVIMVGSFGSIFSGWVFDMTQSYDVAFWIFTALLLPGVV